MKSVFATHHAYSIVSPVPVPEGALLRYDPTTFGGFGQNWSLGVIRNEEYNAMHHPDVLTDEADSKLDPLDHSNEIVEDRITWIKVCSGAAKPYIG